MRQMAATALLMAGGLFLVAVGDQPGLTAEEKSAEPAGRAVTVQLAQESRSSAADREEPKKLRGRLPRNYGKLGVSQEQRRTIYSIQEKYRSQIEDLEKQLAALESQRDRDIAAVLTEGQKVRLKELEAASARKRASSSKTAE